MIWYATLSKDNKVYSLYSSGSKTIVLCWDKTLGGDYSISVHFSKPLLVAKKLSDDGFARSNDEKPNFDLKRTIDEAIDTITSYGSTISIDDRPTKLRMQDANKA